MLLSIDDDMGARNDPERVLRRLVESAIQAFGAQHAGVFLGTAEGTFEAKVTHNLSIEFIQVLEQVAQAHRDHAASAHDDTGRRTAGRAFGLSAAVDLHQAAIAHAQAFRRLDRAAQSSGRIAWYPDDPAHRVPVTLAAGHTVEAVTTSSRPIMRVSEPGL